MKMLKVDTTSPAQFIRAGCFDGVEGTMQASLHKITLYPWPSRKIDLCD